jgi:phage major head subunit gpT-like protein
MPLNTAKALVTLNGLTAKFDNRVAAATPFYPRISTVFPSNRLTEDYAFLGNMPGVREWDGDRQFKELRGARFAIENKHWESSLAIKKTDIDDDNLGLYGPLMEALADEASYHPDELLFETLVAGDGAACFDGQFFYDTDHVWGDSGSQSNDLTSTVVLNTAVTAAEFRASYHQAREAMLNFSRDNGKLFHRPTIGNMSDLMILVPTELELAAHEAIRSIVLANNTNIVLDSPSIVTSAHLTTATEWYLFHLGGVLKPFVFQNREPIMRQMKGEDDLEFKDVKFMTEARYNVGYLAWWSAVLTTFATA